MKEYKVNVKGIDIVVTQDADGKFIRPQVMLDSNPLGSALKPAFEPIILARKPLENTIAGNVLKWGTGAINIDGCRVGVKDETQMYVQPRPTTDKGTASWSKGEHTAFHYGTSGGRWPANLLLGWPEDEYELKDNISADNLRQLAGWLDENPKL